MPLSHSRALSDHWPIATFFEAGIGMVGRPEDSVLPVVCLRPSVKRSPDSPCCRLVYGSLHADLSFVSRGGHIRFFAPAHTGDGNEYGEF
jgi:hypothetical protein